MYRIVDLALNVDPVRQNCGVIKRDGVPSRHQWLPSALPGRFGEEPEVPAPWPGLLDGVSEFAARAAEVRDNALRDTVSVDGVEFEFTPGSGDTQFPTRGGIEHVRTPMRVVLMGRTMAGKSSLLSALSGTHLDRIGDGRQRFSRDVFMAASSASDRIEIVDTPGVGARDGAEDFDKAFNAALDADLVLWVASSDSIQETTAIALRLLGAIGKPIIVVLNCRQSLEGVGRLNLLRFPEQVFGNREGLVDEIRRHMAAAAVEPLDVVYVHALAATKGITSGQLGASLHAASRIDDLVHALAREYDTHSDSRQALRIIDRQRIPVEEMAMALRSQSTTLQAHAERKRRITKDVHVRLDRVLRLAVEAMNFDIEAAVGRRRDWHLTTTDFGKALQLDWKAAVANLQEELHATLEEGLRGLATEMESMVAATDAEWNDVFHEKFALEDLPGFSAVWGNRLGRAGVGIGGALAGGAAGAALGAQIGGVVGLPTGPGVVVTIAIGTIVGTGVGLAVKPVKGLVDRVFQGRDAVLQRRRNEVARQVGPILDELTSEYGRAINERLDVLRTGLASDRARSEQNAVSLREVAGRLANHALRLQRLIAELDRVTTVSLLRIAGRERLARSVRRSTRVPGVCILAEFEDSAFWEAWFYLPDIGEKLVAGKSAPAGGEAASSLSYALGFIEAPVRLVKANSTAATLRIDENIPANITAAWADALTAHLGEHIQIETSWKATNP